MSEQNGTVVIGAGPAGLTAAYELLRHGRSVQVFEADEVVGGISRTVERDGWRFDIGGHRFFTKVPRVRGVLARDPAGRGLPDPAPDEPDLLPGRPVRLPAERHERPAQPGSAGGRPLPRLVRPGPAAAATRPVTLRGLGVGPVRLAAVLDLLQDVHREGLGYAGGPVAGRLGGATDQEPVAGHGDPQRAAAPASAHRRDQPDRGVPVPEVRARDDVGALRRAGPRAGRAAVHRQLGHRRAPRPGPPAGDQRDGQRRGRAAYRGSRPRDLVHADLGAGGRAAPAGAAGGAGRAADLRYRDFLTVALVVPAEFSFPDNWIYVHDPGVRVGRIQNFGSWSPYLVKDGRTCLGLEYFVVRGRRDVAYPGRRSGGPRHRGAGAVAVWFDPAWWRPATWCACPRPTRSTTSATSTTWT